MCHAKSLCWAGCLVIGFGVLLCLCGGSFSTQWEFIGNETVPRTMNPALALGLRTFGNATLLLGFGVLGGAAWIWLNAKEENSFKLRPH